MRAELELFLKLQFFYVRGGQWPSGRVLDIGVHGSSLTGGTVWCPLPRLFILCFVQVQARTRPNLTEILVTVTNDQISLFQSLIVCSGYNLLFCGWAVPASCFYMASNTPKIVTFVIGKMKLVSFILFLDASPQTQDALWTTTCRYKYLQHMWRASLV